MAEQDEQTVNNVLKERSSLRGEAKIAAETKSVAQHEANRRSATDPDNPSGDSFQYEDTSQGSEFTGEFPQTGFRHQDSGFQSGPRQPSTYGRQYGSYGDYGTQNSSEVSKVSTPTNGVKSKNSPDESSEKNAPTNANKY